MWWAEFYFLQLEPGRQFLGYRLVTWAWLSSCQTLGKNSNEGYLNIPSICQKWYPKIHGVRVSFQNPGCYTRTAFMGLKRVTNQMYSINWSSVSVSTFIKADVWAICGLEDPGVRARSDCSFSKLCQITKEIKCYKPQNLQTCSKIIILYILQQLCSTIKASHQANTHPRLLTQWKHLVHEIKKLLNR